MNRLKIVVGLALSLGLAACSSDDSPSLGTANDVSDSAVEIAAQPVLDQTVLDQTVLDQTVIEYDTNALVFGDLRFTLERVTHTNASPLEFGDTNPQTMDSFDLWAEFELTSLIENVSSGFRRDDIFLELPDGTLLTPKSANPTGTVARGSTRSISASWNLTDDIDWRASTIVIGPGELLRARFPIAGPESVPSYPVTVEIATAATAGYDGFPNDMEVTLRRVDFDVNLGSALGRTRRRPETGSRFVRVHLAVTNATSFAFDMQLTAPQLLADGRALEPVTNDGAELLVGEETGDITWAFSIPVDSADLIFRTGDTRPMEVAIAMPELPLMPGEVIS